MAMQTWASISAVNHECAASTCDATTCRLSRGCLLLTMQTLEAPQQRNSSSNGGGPMRQGSVVSRQQQGSADGQSPSPSPQQPPLEWLSPLELATKLQGVSPGLVRAAALGGVTDRRLIEPPGGGGAIAAERPAGVLMAALLPASLLESEGVVLPGGCPQPGVVGWLRAEPKRLVGPLARLCFVKVGRLPPPSPLSPLCLFIPASHSFF